MQLARFGRSRQHQRGILPQAYLETMTVERSAGALNREMRGAGVHSLVAESAAGQVVGLLTGGIDRRRDRIYRAEIFSLYVLRAFRRRGLGRELVRRFAAGAKPQPLPVMPLLLPVMRLPTLLLMPPRAPLMPPSPWLTKPRMPPSKPPCRQRKRPGFPGRFYLVQPLDRPAATIGLTFFSAPPCASSSVFLPCCAPPFLPRRR